MEMEEMRREKSWWSNEGKDKDNQENMEEDKRNA